MKKMFLSFTLILMLLGMTSSLKGASDFETKSYNLSVQNTDLKVFLEMIASQAGMELRVSPEVKGNVSYGFTNITLKTALDRITRDNNLSYRVKNSTIHVSGAREPASVSEGRLPGNIHRIMVRNTTVTELAPRLPSVLLPGETLTADEFSNALVFSGSEATLEKIRGFVEAFDHEPRQILIEAQVVEASKNFTQDFGFRFGDSTAATTTLESPGYSSGFIDTGIPDAPTFMGRYVMGIANGVNLEAILAAAESNGEAEVISKPKIVTLNNVPARINSGIQFYVKTLSSLTTGAGEDEEAVASGLQTISAGFELMVTPTVLGSDRVRLALNVSNSEPNDGLGVDGIPGIIDNSAMTSIIVKDGQTATIAGLLKSTKGDFNTSVPFLSKIPILGLFFQSHSKRDRTTELVIFVTPRLIKNVVSEVKVPALDPIVE